MYGLQFEMNIGTVSGNRFIYIIEAGIHSLK